jgi:hypothetical protein
MASVSLAAQPATTQQVQITVAEPAGIRRFGYPVATVLELPEPVPAVTHFRLLEQGKPVVAQFRPHGDTRGGIRAVSLDFNVNHAPLESRQYLVEYGPRVEPGPEPKAGLRVEITADDYRINHPGGLQFVVPRHLLGLLRQVRTGKMEYLHADSPGLFLRYKDDIHFRAGGVGPDGVPTVGQVTKEGPLAVTLRFEGTEALRGNRSVTSAVELDFPVSKSWVRVRWEVDDPEGYIGGLGADLALNIEGEPTLVDFGAGSLVYAALRRGEVAMLRGGSLEPAAPPWQALVGPVEHPRPYVVAAAGTRTPAAEGWAHVMDRQRATAVAVAGFADPRQEADLTIDAGGRLRLWKQFAQSGSAAPRGMKKMTFWLHFVGMPVQVGAATSPQAMLAPLAVSVRGRP